MVEVDAGAGAATAGGCSSAAGFVAVGSTRGAGLPGDGATVPIGNVDGGGAPVAMAGALFPRGSVAGGGSGGATGGSGGAASGSGGAVGGSGGAVGGSGGIVPVRDGCSSVVCATGAVESGARRGCGVDGSWSGDRAGAGTGNGGGNGVRTAPTAGGTGVNGITAAFGSGTAFMVIVTLADSLSANGSEGAATKGSV